MLTPGLTYEQGRRLEEYLLRLSGLAKAPAVALYQDADRVAGRILNPYGPLDVPRGLDTTGALRAGHAACPGPVVGYVAGLAFGVRLGRTFTAPPRRRSTWISEEYRRLSESSRREVQRFIRRLLKAQEAPQVAAPWAASGRGRGRQRPPVGP